MIKIDNVSKSYGNKAIFKDVSLVLKEGSIIGLYGESGCGKSTFAKMLCGLLKPDKGSIKENMNVQMVYQEPIQILDPNQRILDGIKELISYHRFADKKDRDALIEKMCEKVSLKKDILNHYPHQISGGEAQRIAILKAFLFNPDLLIFDEATQMLDASTQANILSMTKRELSKSYKTLLFISHDKELVKFYCDIVYVVENKGLKMVNKNEW